MPLFWIGIAFIIGIAAASHADISSQTIVFLLLITLITSIFEMRWSLKHKHFLLQQKLFKIPISLLFAASFSGALIFHNNLPIAKEDHISMYTENHQAAVIGLIHSDPIETNRYTSAIISAMEIIDGGKTRTVTGKIRVTLPQGIPISYGDIVRMEGTLDSTLHAATLPHQSRDGRQKVFVKMDFPEVEIVKSYQGNPILSALYTTREQANIAIFDMMPYPESAVLSGILLGLDTSIPEYLWNGYRATGIAHIIAISGFNISIFTHLLYRALDKKMRTSRALPITILTVILYTILVGAETPVVRAAIMATIGLPASRIGRKTIGIHNLILAATIMLAINPFLLWEISFQLSFLATLALQVMVDPINHWIMTRGNLTKEGSKDHPLLNIITPTICASFVVFPILFRITGTISVVSLLANSLVGPLQPFIMLGGGIATIISLISPFIGRVLGAFVWPLVAFCNQVALRLSVNPASTRYLPGEVYVVSLFCVSAVLVYFSVKQIIILSNPVKLTD